MRADEVKSKLEPLCKMKEDLIDICKAELAKGASCVDTKEMGEAIDMVKDLAEAEQACWSAAYYEQVVKAMEDQTWSMGYNPNRSSTSGRYMRGYSDPTTESEMPYIMEYLDDPMGFQRSMRMGYSGGSRGGSSSSSSMGSGRGSSSNSGSSSGSMSRGYSDRGHEYDYGDMNKDMTEWRNGQAYKRWKDARRHYTQTGDKADKDEMSSAANEHVASMIATMRDIWKSAETDQKKRMKADIQALLGEMTV